MHLQQDRHFGCFEVVIFFSHSQSTLEHMPSPLPHLAHLLATTVVPKYTLDALNTTLNASRHQGESCRARSPLCLPLVHPCSLHPPCCDVCVFAVSVGLSHAFAPAVLLLLRLLLRSAPPRVGERRSTCWLCGVRTAAHHSLRTFSGRGEGRLVGRPGRVSNQPTKPTNLSPGRSHYVHQRPCPPPPTTRRHSAHQCVASTRRLRMKITIAVVTIALKCGCDRRRPGLHWLLQRL